MLLMEKNKVKVLKQENAKCAGRCREARIHASVWSVPSLIVSLTSQQLDFKFQQPHQFFRLYDSSTGVGERAATHKTKTSMSPEAEKIPALSGQTLFITRVMCTLLNAFSTENIRPTLLNSWLQPGIQKKSSR